MTQRGLVALTLLIGLALTNAAGAHHAAQTQFDMTQNILMTGVLVKYEPLNPHSYMTFTVTKPDGTMEEWKMEALAAVAMQRAGISVRDNMKAGQPYKIVYSPSRNGAKVGFLTSILLHDGKFIAFGPESNVKAARELSK